MDKYINYFPSPAANNGIYSKLNNDYWTSSFWSGILWLAYENTSNDKYIEVLDNHLKSFDKRLSNKIGIDTHDLGFLYTLSCTAAYKVKNNNYAKQLSLKAADLLFERYQNQAKIIQAWGFKDDSELNGRMIIDCLMNLPLLYWASIEKGDNKYREAAENHTIQAMNFLVRDDFSTFHTFYMDVDTGKPIKGSTAQGYSDDSSWARGQAWAIYGFALGYRYTNNINFLNTSINTANYFISKLPNDGICYWDLIFSKGNEERDSSAAAIAACGLLELSNNIKIDDKLKTYYKNIAVSIFNILTNSYLDNNKLNLGILKHSVYSKPDNKGIDECTIWGDYFYFELLTRFNINWKPYW